ncbi:MAG: SCO family protein [Gammaproteobacteria bacterium]
MPTSTHVLPKLIAVGFISVMAFCAGLYFAQTGDRPSIPGLLWPNPPRVGAFSLTDSKSERLTEEALNGHWTLLFFGFTHCPDVCPTTLSTLKTVHTQLSRGESFQAPLQVLFISIDPARDGPQTLHDYIQYFDPAFLAATGTDDELKKLTRQLGVIYAKVRTADPNTYTMDHSASVLLIGPDLALLGVFTPPLIAPELADRVRAVIEFAQKPT